MKNTLQLRTGRSWLGIRYLPLAVLAAASWHVAAAQTPVTKYGAVQVRGNQILSQAGQPASLAGNSLFWSTAGWGGERYYTANVVGWLKTNWNTSIVRVAMGVDEAGSYLENNVREKAKVKTVVDAGIAACLYVIIGWHLHHAEAIACFREMGIRAPKAIS